MEQTEDFKDWLFRYQFIYRTRKSNRGKERFVGGLMKDLLAMGKKPHVIEYDQQKKTASRNIYVGNLKKANKIICTYYDTPSQFFGNYHLFNQKKQGQQTIAFILVSTLLWFGVGLVGTLAYMQTSYPFDFSKVQTYGAIAAYGVFFYLFGKVSKGLAVRKNLVRNTSSILAMLSLIENNQAADVAFAFLDEGVHGRRGLEVMKTSTKGRPEIFVLDSIGSTAPLWITGDSLGEIPSAEKLEQADSQLRYIFTGELEKAEYILTKAQLAQKQLNLQHLETVIAALS